MLQLTTVLSGLVGKKQLSWFATKDYRYLRYELVPHVREISQASEKSLRPLIRECYVLLADIADLYLDAPRAALRWYRRSLTIYRDDSYVWREIGTMEHRLGNYSSAKRAWKLAQRLGPVDSITESDLASIDCELRGRPSPLYSVADPVYRATEQIAAFFPCAALKTLKKRVSISARRVRARAFEAIGESESAIEEWRKISKSSGPVDFDRSDLFFLSRSTWNSPAFWKSMLDTCSRFGLCIYPRDNTFPLCVPAAARPDDLSEVERYCRIRWKLTAELHLARTRHDKHALESLVRGYPGWKTARIALTSVEAAD